MPRKKSAHQGFSRKDRVCEQIRRELATLIHGELKDPRIGMVSLTEVELTADYAHAKIFFSSLASGPDLAAVQSGLDHAAGFLRRELGKRISIHSTPQLHFVHDHSLENGAQLSKLIAAALDISDATSTTEPSQTPTASAAPKQNLDD
ncbi:MAG: 30S ribosome-binding factor RbfA [Pseudomonadota bacterium]